MSIWNAFQYAVEGRGVADNHVYRKLPDPNNPLAVRDIPTLEMVRKHHRFFELLAEAQEEVPNPMLHLKSDDTDFRYWAKHELQVVRLWWFTPQHVGPVEELLAALSASPQPRGEHIRTFNPGGVFFSFWLGVHSAGSKILLVQDDNERAALVDVEDAVAMLGLPADSDARAFWLENIYRDLLDDTRPRPQPKAHHQDGFGDDEPTHSKGSDPAPWSDK